MWGALGIAALANKDLTGVLLALGLVWGALGTAALANKDLTVVRKREGRERGRAEPAG